MPVSSSGPITQYTAKIRRYLWMNGPVTRDILAEIQSHLEEKVGALMQQGYDRFAAEQQATAEFGDARVIGRNLSAAHPLQMRVLWGGLLWIAGVICAWGAWFLWTYIALAIFVLTHHVAILYDGTQSLIDESKPVAHVFFDGGSEYGQNYQVLSTLGFSLWHYLPMILLFGAIPFIVARQFSRWWVPALCYGLGGTTIFGLYAVRFHQFSRFKTDISIGPTTQLMIGILVLLPVGIALLAAALAEYLDHWRRTHGKRSLPEISPLPNIRRLAGGIGATVLIMVLLFLSFHQALQSYTLSPDASATTRYATIAKHLSFPIHQSQHTDALGLTSVSLNCYICLAATGQEILSLYFSNGIAEKISNQPILISDVNSKNYHDIRTYPATQPLQFQLDGNTLNGWYLDLPESYGKSYMLAWQYDGIWYVLFGDSRDQLLAFANSI
jgi:hypothetical protein